MTHKKILATFAFVGISGFSFNTEKAETYSEPITEKLAFKPSPLDLPTTTDILRDINENVTDIKPNTVTTKSKSEENSILSLTNKSEVFAVPFYSQFTDITSAEWKKVGCGIASLAMLIEFYQPDTVIVNELLNEGINAGAYLSDAGWTHAGLINLSKKYGLTGESHDMAESSMNTAFSKLESVLKDGPVMVSVHYTFDPKNPIPHLVVINGIKDGQVHYNDPAEASPDGTLSISKFKKAWKKRYIEIRSTT